MTTPRILIIGDSISLLREVYETLESRGYEVSIGSGGPSPSLTISRNSPDLLILESGPGLGKLERWRRAIESYRSHQHLSILTIRDRSHDSVERAALDDLSDLGSLPWSLDLEELIARLEDRFESDDPMQLVA